MRLISLILMIQANIASAQSEDQPSNVDFEGFVVLSQEVYNHRADRLVDVDTFVQMSGDGDTIILDTRSKSAFDDIHVTGAVHLNFSDFTESSLAKVIPDKDTRILIYCNNNFFSPLPSLRIKNPNGALNISTFIALYSYGYKNVYELGTMVPVDDDKLSLTAGDNVMTLVSDAAENHPDEASQLLGINPGQVVPAGTD